MELGEFISFGLQGAGGLSMVGATYLYMTQQDLRRQLEEIKRSHEDCKEHTGEELEEGNKNFTRLEVLITKGFGDMNTKLARIEGKAEGKDELAKNIAESIRSLADTQKLNIPR